MAAAAKKLTGLWNPFLVDLSGDEPDGRRAPVLMWDAGAFTTATELPADKSGKSPLQRGLLDASLAIVLPGFVCGHVEPALALFAGYPALALVEDADTRARRLLSALERDDVSAAAMLCAAEAALAGVTLVYVLHRAPLFDGVLDVIADAFRVAGVRVVASAAIDERAGGPDAARAALRENVRFAEACAKRDDGMSAAFAGLAHPLAVPSLLGEVVAGARRAELPFHLLLHEPADARRRLAEKGALRSGSVAVVAAPLDDEERALLRDLEVFPVTTPREDAARGIPPPALRGFARRAVFGGFEGSADVLAERDAFVAARASFDVAEKIPGWRPIANGWDLAATTLERTFGRWTSGSPADLVVLDEPIPGALSSTTLAAHFERVTARHVRHVVVAGRTVVKDGALVTMDIASARAEASKAAYGAWSRTGKRS